MSLELLSILTFVALVIVFGLLAIIGGDLRSLRVLTRLAPRYSGGTKGRILFPRLIFTLDGARARLSHQWSRRAAAGGQLIFRQKFLIFTVSTDHLKSRADFLIYTRIGWTSLVRQVGFESYVSGDPVFDERFVVFTKGEKGKVAAILDYTLRQKLMALKANTNVLEVLIMRHIFQIKYQKDRLENEQEIDDLLQQFIDICRHIGT